MAINTAVKSPADLANVALVRMGYKAMVGSLYDGSTAGTKLLNIYSQTRDEALREHDYDFAERNVSLTLLKQAPATGYFPPTTWDPTLYPPPGFAFEYGFPDDALKIRNVKQQPMFLFNADPQPNAFQIATDNSFTPAQRVILCQVPSAVGVYTAQVTDPATWDVAFTDYLAAKLARHLAAGLVGLEGAKMEAAAEKDAAEPAMTDGR